MINKTSNKNKANSSQTKASSSVTDKSANTKAKPTGDKETSSAASAKPKVNELKSHSSNQHSKSKTSKNKATGKTKASVSKSQSKAKPRNTPTMQSKAGQLEVKKATTVEKTQAKDATKSTIAETAKSISPKPTAKQVDKVKTALYEEPDAPLALTPAPVEKTDSITPPIPENSNTAPLQEELQADNQGSADQYQPPGPQHAPKYIVQITPELAPLAKVGGLADVVTGLSRELEMRGNNVEIILPKYDSMRYDHIWGLCVTHDDLWVPWYGGHVHCTVWFGFVHDRKCFFIEPHSPENFFNRGAIYGFDDDVLRFAFFSRAALEFMLKSGKHPDIIHCHDWQTALVPVLLYEIYQHIGMTKPRVCFTIHNYKHQGVTGDFLLDATGLCRPDYYFHYDRLLDNTIPHALNLMKGGVVYSNFITTVSPRYAGETKDGGQGFGLEPTLHRHHYKYGGVVNGIDYDTWNPEIDEHISVQYTVDNIDDKYANKHALRQRLLLAESNKPIIAFIGRLDPQKGLDLVRHALFYALNNDSQFVLLGSSPDQDINNYFWELKRHLNDSPDCHIEVGFDEDLAHLIYAGSDMMIVPSLFEPCGLTQLIAMKYGTIPVVRAVGGLADTVFDKDNAHDKPLHERNGFVFNDYDDPGIESALSRAISCYYQYPEHFRDLIINAMRTDYSWRLPGQHYLNIYDYIANND
jgi:starch synthase